MKIRYIYPSEFELDEAVEYYEYQLPGLGKKFYYEVERAIERIILSPKPGLK
ncbi:hypothetical protein ISS22_03495 [candidate division KSB1 bacterium]|nr:hypothetical protein [candidate division KSB1 bacterium]